MADRYWVGGSDLWGTSGAGSASWAATSGGAGGAGIPTTSDRVIFDSNSGAVTVTVSGSAQCGGCICTSGNVTLAGVQPLTCNGDMDFSGFLSGSTYSGTITLGSGVASAIRGTLSPVGMPSMTVVVNSGTYTNSFSSYYGVVTVSGTGTLTVNAAVNSKTFSMSAGTLNGTSTVVVTPSASGTVFNVTGGTVGGTVGVTVAGSNLSASSAVALAGGGKTYGGTVGFVGMPNSTTCQITGSNSFSALVINNSSSSTGGILTMPAGGVTTLTSSGTALNAIGYSAANKLTINSSTPGSQSTISKSASSNISVQYVSLQDSAGTGGATFTDFDGTNVSNNTGWTFAVSPTGDTLFFGTPF